MAVPLRPIQAVRWRPAMPRTNLRPDGVLRVGTPGGGGGGGGGRVCAIWALARARGAPRRGGVGAKRSGAAAGSQDPHLLM